MLSVIACHNMPRLPRELHVVPTWRNPDIAIRKKHATVTAPLQSAARASCKMTMDVSSGALATKHATHLLTPTLKYCAQE